MIHVKWKYVIHIKYIPHTENIPIQLCKLMSVLTEYNIYSFSQMNGPVLFDCMTYLCLNEEFTE